MSRYLTQSFRTVVRPTLARFATINCSSSSSLSSSSHRICRAAPIASFHSSAAQRFAADPASAAAPSALQANEVTERVLNVVKKYDKIKDASKVTANARFAADLGLDSLDAVEVVMGFEDEFGIEIPDNEADKIQSTADAIKYILAQPKAQ